MRKNTPNEALRALLGEARWTGHSFALAVNRVALEAGVVLRYDRTAVAHWLSGSRPRPPVPEFVAQALSRRLGRPVPVADTGLRAASACPAEPAVDKASAASALLQLITADLDPACRSALCRQPFRVEWAATPAWTGGRAGRDPRPARVCAVERETAEAISAMRRAFATADQAFGGGHARLALAAYLATDVTTWLLACPEDNHRTLFGATAALTHLTGFMCFDNLHHNLAQRYYRAALRLADEAGDATAHALVLRGMSVQAWFLGHYRQAACLADAAVDRVGGRAAPGARAAILGQAAVAHAALSHRGTALSRLAEAEGCLDEAEEPPAQRTDRADLAHLTGQALVFLRASHRAETALRDSLRHRPEAERRSRMLTIHHLADLQLRQGRLEQSCATWHRFLDDYPRIHSARVDLAFRTFRRKLSAHRDNTTARDALHRAARVAG
ncbi:putative transcriptional regulator [Actinokineospora spheciospongiae]|uniref:Putative transcriptional regulator n=1 Tax=Actinokineospora spheciospongiae TaxID=909613 RepID=W7J567_9PSEU|nr:hypothetical protein [Actinokineospora spheciospongiae]EWC64177.1 putative transcriptional regulator [Actinokineospora spheciospongiae]